MQQLAHPTSERFVATMGEGVELYSAICPLQSGCSTYIVVDRSTLSTSSTPTIYDYMGC